MIDPTDIYGILFDTNSEATEFAALMRSCGYRSKVIVNRGNGIHGQGVNYSVISHWQTVPTVRCAKSQSERIMECVHVIASSHTSQKSHDAAVKYLLSLANS